MKLTASNASVTNTIVSSILTIGNTTVDDKILTVGDVSINASTITVGNTSISPTNISTSTLIIGGETFTEAPIGAILDYKEFTANGVWYNPYVNASVNASLTGQEQVFVMAWGGGAGGWNNVAPFGLGAGGGGACVIGTYPLSTVPNTVIVTVGLGGLGYAQLFRNSANNGGNSIFHTLTAYGGGDGGGGWLGVNGDPLSNTESTFGGSTRTGAGGYSIFGGGGSAGGFGNGGASIYGGGGGGSGVDKIAGVSIFGGNGGITTGDISSSNGKIPGGGGGTYSSNTSGTGNGARGEVRVWVIGPAT